MNGLMTEVIEERVDPANDAERTHGVEELIDAVQAYEPGGFGRGCDGL